MLDHEYAVFEEKICELAQALRAPLPAPGLTKHLWMAARGFTLETFSKACDDLAAGAEFFPKPVELKRACEAYGTPRPGTVVPHLRCLHVDYERAPLADDTDERHWRCPATFPYAAGTIYCPKHAPLYVPGEPAPPAEIHAVLAASLTAHPSSLFVKSLWEGHHVARKEDANGYR